MRARALLLQLASCLAVLTVGLAARSQARPHSAGTGTVVSLTGLRDGTGGGIGRCGGAAGGAAAGPGLWPGGSLCPLLVHALTPIAACTAGTADLGFDEAIDNGKPWMINVYAHYVSEGVCRVGGGGLPSACTHAVQAIELQGQRQRQHREREQFQQHEHEQQQQPAGAAAHAAPPCRCPPSCPSALPPPAPLSYAPPAVPADPRAGGCL